MYYVCMYICMMDGTCEGHICDEIYLAICTDTCEGHICDDIYLSIYRYLRRPHLWRYLSIYLYTDTCEGHICDDIYLSICRYIQRYICIHEHMYICNLLDSTSSLEVEAIPDAIPAEGLGFRV